MVEVIRHRGPDDDGTYVNDGIGLGVRRLSIIDIEGGRQPISNEDRTLQLVFNGELYNYRSLRTELQRLGHRFETQSDTEVVVHAYEQWKNSCLDRFRGMFAFGLWDERDRNLLLAVDRFGIKPLYYGLFDGDIVFGSELSCLLASNRLRKDLDDNALAEYFTLGYIPPPATVFRDARKLEPGTFLRWNSRGVAVNRYWDVPAPETLTMPAPDLHRQLRQELREAVRAHMVSDVPIGAFLSGGIDSSSVVALMGEVSDRPVQTFSIGFRDRAFDERTLARQVAKHLKTDHQELVVDPESVDVLPILITHFHEPFADPSALPTYYVSELAARSVKVALSGDGGDELFIGYTTFLGVEAARHAQALPDPARRAVGAVGSRLPSLPSSTWNDRAARWRKWIADTMLSPEDAYRSKITAIGLSVVAPLLANGLRARLAPRNGFRAVNEALATWSAENALDRIIYAGLKVSLPGDMLVKVDRMSMANSLEVRVPLLDHVLAEFVAALPVRTRFPHWRLKGLLKDTMADALPPEVLRQRKHGFNVPLSAWFRGDLAAYASDILLGKQTQDRGFYDVAVLREVLGQHRRGARNLGPVIWSLLIFELWCRELLD